MSKLRKDYQHYFQQGAREFLSGVHVVVFNEVPRCWQHKAKQDGDKAMRAFLFGEVFPGRDKIRAFHRSILEDVDPLYMVEWNMNQFNNHIKGSSHE